MAESDDIESILTETREFPPAREFASAAHLSSNRQYETMYARSIKDPEGFWGDIAKDFHWFNHPTKILEWKPPFARWFADGTTNLSYNCLDLQIERGRGDHPAILWEGEPYDTAAKKPRETRTVTFSQLRDQVCRFANVLKKLDVKKGDRVTIYMPMVPELPVAMLACARIGAPHSIIFGGFSAQSIADRLEDAQSRVIITADGGWRRGAVIPLKANVDEACEKTDLVETVVVLRRCDNPINMRDGRDHWWHELTDDASDDCPAEQLEAEHMLYLLYTSGTTGKPKGIVHTTGGYMVYTALTAKFIFDLKPDDMYWCTADIGWVTGHSYIVYGILQNGVTTLMYEGAPNFPEWDRFWDIVERHKVTKFYTAPTAIRAFMKQGTKYPNAHDLSSLRLLGTVGEPINPEAWMWYHQTIGHEKCPIVDTWWQTETGGILITPLPGVTTTKPGSATRPFFGIEPAVMTRDGNPVEGTGGGLLVIKKPWPGMLRGIYGDNERYQKQYWSDIPGVYFTGDGAKRDKDGCYWLMGRVDDVINVSGHRLGTMEVESALVAHAAVAEAAVVGVPHPIKGQAIAAFVTLKSARKPSEELKNDLVAHVATEIGAMAKPEQIRFTDALPKTRSGKIMRRLLREIATEGEVTGDTSTLEDFTVIASLRDDEE